MEGFLTIPLFRIMDILRKPPSLVQTTGFSLDLSLETDGHCRTWLLFLLNIHFCVDFDACLESLLNNLHTTKTELPSRGNQIFCQDFLVLCWINCAPGAHWQQNIPKKSITHHHICFVFFRFGDLKTQPISAIRNCNPWVTYPPLSLLSLGIICTCFLFLATIPNIYLILLLPLLC